MSELRYTLVSDGSSDAALIPILKWLLVQNGVQQAIQPKWADLRGLLRPPSTLAEKVAKSLELYPCELLFIHRDAERDEPVLREQEILEALQQLHNITSAVDYICVIPVRMTEAWLLIDESAIRHAAGNRSGRRSISLPPLRELETLSDPKRILYDLLREASGLSGQRLQKFRVAYHACRVSDLIDDFAPLRDLAAFALLERKILDLVRQKGW